METHFTDGYADTYADADTDTDTDKRRHSFRLHLVPCMHGTVLYI